MLSVFTGLQRAADAAANPAFGYDKRLAAVVSSGGSLVRGYMAEAATLLHTGAPLSCLLVITVKLARSDAPFG